MGRVEDVYPGKDGLVRKTRIRLGNRQLDSKGKAMNDPKYLDRPIQKLVRLVEA